MAQGETVATAAYARSGGGAAVRRTTEGQVKSGSGFVDRIIVSATTATPTAGLLTLYDNTAESGTVLYAGWYTGTTPQVIPLGVPFTTGLFMGFDASLANVSVTVVYS